MFLNKLMVITHLKLVQFFTKRLFEIWAQIIKHPFLCPSNRVYNKMFKKEVYMFYLPVLFAIYGCMLLVLLIRRHAIVSTNDRPITDTTRPPSSQTFQHSHREPLMPSTVKMSKNSTLGPQIHKSNNDSKNDSPISVLTPTSAKKSTKFQTNFNMMLLVSIIVLKKSGDYKVNKEFGKIYGKTVNTCSKNSNNEVSKMYVKQF